MVRMMFDDHDDPNLNQTLLQQLEVIVFFFFFFFSKKNFLMFFFLIFTFHSFSLFFNFSPTTYLSIYPFISFHSTIHPSHHISPSIHPHHLTIHSSTLLIHPSRTACQDPSRQQPQAFDTARTASTTSFSTPESPSTCPLEFARSVGALGVWVFLKVFGSNWAYLKGLGFLKYNWGVFGWFCGGFLGSFVRVFWVVLWGFFGWFCGAFLSGFWGVFEWFLGCF